MSLPAIGTYETFTRDSTPPVLTVDTPAYALLDTDFIFSGLTATDNLQGDLTNSIAMTNDFYRGALGTVEDVEFVVRDADGNTATRLVDVEIQGDYNLSATPYLDDFSSDTLGEHWINNRDDYGITNGKLISVAGSSAKTVTVQGDSQAHVQATFNRNNVPSNSFRLIFRYKADTSYLNLRVINEQIDFIHWNGNGGVVLYSEVLPDIGTDDLTLGVRGIGENIDLIVNGLVIHSLVSDINLLESKHGLALQNTEFTADDFRIARPDSDIDLLTGGIDFPVLSENEMPTLQLSASTLNATAGQTITFTAVATNADTVEFKSSDVDLAGTGNERTAIMPSAASINVTATAKNIIGEVEANVIVNIAEEQLVELENNRVTINIALLSQEKTAEIRSVLASFRENLSSKLFVKPTDAILLSDTFAAISFRLFQIGGSGPLFTKTLVDGITIEDGGILISLPKEDMTTSGDHYFDLTVTQSTPIVILDGRIKLLNGRS